MPDPITQPCAAHELLVENVTAMRQTFDLFVSHAAEEHSKIRDLMARQSEQFHRDLLETVKMISAAKAPAVDREGAPMGPHPLMRAEDYEQRVIVQLSRKDVFRVLGAVALVIVLTIGLALIAGRDGLDLWSKTVAPGVGK